MALMFSRLAHNFVKNGYFPTDEVTLGRILNAIDVDHDEPVNVLDPCAGEGAALAEVAQHLRNLGAAVHTYGVEYDQERAANARQWLDHVAQGDMHEMAIHPRQFGLLFLNPPYGDMVADVAALSESSGGRKRLEKHFFKTSQRWLATDGLLVLIVPFYVMDREFATLIAKGYRDVRVFLAPDQTFKQIVLFATKQKTSSRLDVKLVDALCKISEGELPPELPEAWMGQPYQVPAAGAGDVKFVMHRIESNGLAFELSKISKASLWGQFDMQFDNAMLEHRRPLMPLRKWHLALALAAGQISGLVRSNDGSRLMLVKGDTHKDKSVKVSYEESKNGSVTEIIKSTDKFVPVIQAIEFTPGPNLGRLITIR